MDGWQKVAAKEKYQSTKTEDKPENHEEQNQEHKRIMQQEHTHL